MTRTLITGHKGYIGRHLHAILPDADGIDAKDGNNLLFNGAAIHKGPHDVVFHLAALATVSESVRQPLRYWAVNLSTTSMLLSTLLTCRGFTGRLVFTSSLLAERHDSSSYAATKYACEMMIRNAIRSTQATAVILRLANVCGGGDTTPGRLWVEIARAVQTGEPFCVCGQGQGIFRDYVHVRDVTDALLVASTLPVNPGESVTLDIGSGNATSVQGCLEMAGKVLGYSVPRRVIDGRPGDVRFSVADPEPAACLMGWRATRSLEEIARDALSFASDERETA